MEFRTGISKTVEGAHVICGKDLAELIEKHSFAETIFLLLRGNLPAEKETKLLDAVLVASTENGIEAPSIYVPRVVAASGNAFHVALAAGMLAIGEKHGGAGEQAAHLFSSGKTAQEIAAEHEETKKFVPGFGHKIYKTEDPRASALFRKARELGFSCKAFQLAYDIEKELEARKGRKLPLNVDGAQAASILELGFDWRLGKAIFLMGRLVGMSAHVLEEIKQNNSFYRLDEGDVRYEERI